MHGSVASGHVGAVQVTEWDEPQAVIGSYLHRYAYPDWFGTHEKRGRELQTEHSHRTRDAASCVQLRGEYLFSAEGSGGLRVYDVASIANKNVSQRIISAPFSPLGHDTRVASKNATCVALPTNQPIAHADGCECRADAQREPGAAVSSNLPVRHDHRQRRRVDPGQRGHARGRQRSQQPITARRDVEWRQRKAGSTERRAPHRPRRFDAYIAGRHRPRVVDLSSPLQPRLAAVVPLAGARASALQFRYLFVVDASGLRVVDVTVPDKPRLTGAAIALADARRLYVARTYAYIAAGRDGLAIIDVERPEAPRQLTSFTADGQLNDARDVIVGSTNASLFAYVADGANGLKVVQLTAPDTQPKFYGFSPEPKPRLIAWRKTASPAIALSKGLDRDRAVDESGGQIAVFGRIGSRPFTLPEMQKLYLRPDQSVWSVTDQVRAAGFRAASEGSAMTRAGRLIAAFAVTLAAQAQPLPYNSPHQSVGVVSCGSTLCHGSIRVVPGSNVLQSEYVTWTRLDKHARAYSILFSAQSKKIAKNLGIGSAHEDRLCLDCHAHAPAPALRGERFKVDDGVSCEGCHGPAQRWLAAHVERGATHARNIEHGLFPTDDAVSRARLCLSCHLGNRDRLVTHRLMGAGHPRLSFELDTFTTVEPAHFKADSDYGKRKRLWDGVQVWAIGQAMAVSQTLELLGDPKIGRDGFFRSSCFLTAMHAIDR